MVSHQDCFDDLAICFNDANCVILKLSDILATLAEVTTDVCQGFGCFLVDVRDEFFLEIPQDIHRFSIILATSLNRSSDYRF